MSEGAPERPTRREFAKAVALLAVAAPALPGSLAAAVAAPGGAPARPGIAEAGVPEAGEPGPDPTAAAAVLPESGALLEVIRHRYGRHLTPEQLEAVRLGIEGGLRAAQRLHALRLANGEGPGWGGAYRGEG